MSCLKAHEVHHWSNIGVAAVQPMALRVQNIKKVPDFLNVLKSTRPLIRLETQHGISNPCWYVLVFHMETLNDGPHIWQVKPTSSKDLKRLMFHLSLCHDAIQVNYMKKPYKFKSPTVSEVYATHLQNPCAPHRFARISRVEANINRPGNFNRRHDHGTGTASFLASGLESWSCGILEVEVIDDLTIFEHIWLVLLRTSHAKCDLL